MDLHHYNGRRRSDIREKRDVQRGGSIGFRGKFGRYEWSCGSIQIARDSVLRSFGQDAENVLPVLLLCLERGIVSFASSAQSARSLSWSKVVERAFWRAGEASASYMAVWGLPHIPGC